METANTVEINPPSEEVKTEDAPTAPEATPEETPETTPEETPEETSAEETPGEGDESTVAE